jgi:uncharacterized membrane protein
MIKHIWKIATFMGIQYLLGKRGSFPYGLLMKFSLFKISLLVILNDIVQTIILLQVMEGCVARIALRKKKKNKLKPSWIDKLKQYGEWGIFTIAALPYGGGALTSSIVAISIKMDKRKATLIIISGCVVGTLIFYLGFTGIMAKFSFLQGL